MTRRQRAALIQVVLYAVLVVGIVVLALVADWPTIRDNFWNPDGVSWADGNWQDLITIGLVNTVKYTAIAFGGGLALGLLLALMRLSPVAPYRWLATAYIEFFRGLPALVVMVFMATGLPIAFGWTPPGGLVGAGLIGLILVAGAYMAETLRAGIQAVPKGQTEAARSLGMRPGATTVRVVLPQAFRIVIPPLTNEFVLLIKDTALLFLLGAAADQRELTSVARDFLSSGPSTGTATSLIQAAILYLVITLPLTQLVAWLERRQRRAVR
ncbi:amino acid ABC transporter permease [Pimelobacter simplex]|uniref:Putative ABC transporter permease protein n=1 Tax=Nocardioides simplex TaxID=2045 RepID=A0A0A1DKR5_NOCSI|nr:amino acid ABC transporter permease [Pimelobacter simplex]AIY17242.1 putative ABC transporter permease protein [Pimelobacter simplex]GEB13261.1 amino acid ABC transporter permease [Pimelobacter simplex]SFM47306.1 amino acid ABC transporter membrane protein, PAAT family [Pimelobacter simplex]